MNMQPVAKPVARKSLAWAGIGLLAICVVMFIDREVALFGASLPWEVVDAAAVLTEFGEGQWMIVPPALLFIWGWRSGRDNLARWAFLLGITVVGSGLIANAIKIVFGRWRPVAFIEGEEYGFNWFAFGSVRASFPSGHATTAAATAVVLALWFPKWRWVAITIGVAIASTRVVLSMHYPSDIIAGWTLGAACVSLALWIWWRLSPTSVPVPMTLGVPRSPVAIVWTAIILGTIARTIAGIFLPLGVDEAYEVATCKSVVLSGFDHPPLVYWMTRAGLWLNSLMNPLGAVDPIWIRTPFILAFAFSTWLAWRMCALAISPAAGAWAAALLNLSALFCVAIGGWALPDGPLLVAILLAAYCLVRGGVTASGQVAALRPWSPTKTWVLVGLALGLAALAKYQAILTAVAISIYLLTTPHGRRALLTPAPWIGAAIALAMTAPIVIWNGSNDWVSLRFQGGRASSVGGLHPLRMLELLGSQAGILLPWIWGPLVFEWIKGVRAGRSDPTNWFFVCLAGVPVLFFLTISLWGSKGLPHWSAIGYLFAFPLLGAATAHELAQGKRTLVRCWLGASGALLIIAMTLGVSQASTGWVTRALGAAQQVKDPTLEALSWKPVRKYITARAQARAALNSAFAPPAPPPIVLTTGSGEDQACDDSDESLSGAAQATAAAITTTAAPLVEAFAAPPASPSSWRRTPPKVTRPERAADPTPPIGELDVDVLARCGDEGVSTEGFFIAGISWRDTGKLAVAVEGLGIPVTCLASDSRQFAWNIPHDSLIGRDALIIVPTHDRDSVEQQLSGSFRTLSAIAAIRINRGSDIAETLTVFCGLDFDPKGIWRYGE